MPDVADKPRIEYRARPADPLSLADFEPVLDAAMAAHRPFYDFQFERDGPDGSVRRLSVSGEPMFDGTGRYIGYRGIGVELTAKN